MGSRPDRGADALPLWRNAHDFAAPASPQGSIHQRFVNAFWGLRWSATTLPLCDTWPRRQGRGLVPSRSVRKPQCRQTTYVLCRELHLASAQLALFAGCEAFAALVTSHQLAGASEVLDDGSLLHTSLLDRIRHCSEWPWTACSTRA